VNCLSRAVLPGTKDQKHKESGGDNDDDEDDQSRAGEAGSLLRWPSGGFHFRLDAGRESGGGFGVEVPKAYFFRVGGLVFLQGFWENTAADCGFLMVKSWWIAGERWSEKGP